MTAQDTTKSFPKLILGIDPGIKGAITALNYETGEIVAAYNMPTFQAPKTYHRDKTSGRKVSAVGLAELFEKISPHVLFAVIEEVGSMPKDGVVSAFTFGFGTALVHGVMAAFKIPVHQVRPTVWKMLLNVTKDKPTCLAEATRLFPNAKNYWPTTVQSGHAEGALLAHFGRKSFLSHYLNPPKVEPSEFAKDLL